MVNKSSMSFIVELSIYGKGTFGLIILGALIVVGGVLGQLNDLKDLGYLIIEIGVGFFIILAILSWKNKKNYFQD